MPRLLHLLDHILGQLAVQGFRCFVPQQTLGGLRLLLPDPDRWEDRSREATLDIGDDALQWICFPFMSALKLNRIIASEESSTCTYFSFKKMLVGPCIKSMDSPSVRSVQGWL